MAIDGAVSQTAVEAWDKRWATSEGRADWLEPHPAVVAILPELHARGARRVLDLGCGVGRHALLLAHGFDVEAIDGSLAGLAVVRETAAARGLPARRLRRFDPGAVIRPVPGEWHPRMPAQLDEEELADWRAGRNAVYLAALTVGARLAVADA